MEGTEYYIISFMQKSFETFCEVKLSLSGIKNTIKFYYSSKHLIKTSKYLEICVKLEHIN
jgi:hypothetical protein